MKVNNELVTTILERNSDFSEANATVIIPEEIVSLKEEDIAEIKHLSGKEHIITRNWIVGGLFKLEIPDGVSPEVGSKLGDINHIYFQLAEGLEVSLINRIPENGTESTEYILSGSVDYFCSPFGGEDTVFVPNPNDLQIVKIVEPRLDDVK